MWFKKDDSFDIVKIKQELEVIKTVLEQLKLQITSLRGFVNRKLQQEETLKDGLSNESLNSVLLSE